VLSRSRLARCRQAFEQYTRRRPPKGDGSGSTWPQMTQRLIRRRWSLLGSIHGRFCQDLAHPVLSKNLVDTPSFPLRSVAIVVMNDAAEHVTAAHWSLALVTRFWDWNLLGKTLMGSCCVEEYNVFTHDAP
jgi:hypothetical protein